MFVFYAGHGVRVVEGKRYERTAREALVPIDGDDDPSKLIFDHELNAELATIAETTKNLTLILDACCSAGAFREVASPSMGTNDVRRSRPRAIPAVEAPAPPASRKPSALGAVDDWAVIAACRADQRANESADATGTVHGELSRSLLAALAAADPARLASLRWDDVWWSVEREVRSRSPQQAPQIFSGWRRSIFGGPPVAARAGVRVERTSPGIYAVDAGTLAGVSAGAEIALDGGGMVRVDRAERTSARGTLTTPEPGPAQAWGRLRATPPDDRVRVRFVGLEPLPSGLVVAARDGAVDFTVTRTAKGLRIDDDLDRDALGLAPYLEIAAKDAPLATELLEHAVTHHAPLRWARRANDLPDAIEIRVAEYRDGRVTDVPRDARGAFTATYGKGYVFIVDNTSPRELDVALFEAGSSGAVQLLGQERIPALGTHTFWRNSTVGQPFFPQSAERNVDRLVAIASTDGVVARSLVQPSFETVLQRPTRGAAMRGEREAPEPPEQWASDTALLLLVPARETAEKNP